MTHVLPPLPFAMGALDPWIDERTMKVHHGKHHQTYVDKLNETLKGHDALLKTPVESILADLKLVPDAIRQKVVNFGGGVANHTFFWHSLRKGGGMPSGALAKAIERDFGGFEKFKEQFSAAANTLFGSGWAWLVLDGEKLKVVQTVNQDSPLSKGLKPLLTLDVWEHSYYLLYMQNRAAYVSAWWDYVNWDMVERRYAE